MNICVIILLVKHWMKKSSQSQQSEKARRYHDPSMPLKSVKETISDGNLPTNYEESKVFEDNGTMICTRICGNIRLEGTYLYET